MGNSHVDQVVSPTGLEYVAQADIELPNHFAIVPLVYRDSASLVIFKIKEVCDNYPIPTQ
jgi:hypothetical protein